MNPIASITIGRPPAALSCRLRHRLNIGPDVWLNLEIHQL
jgi:hypothetical protein